MEEIQRFAIKNIYCSPGQDQQYRFNLIRVTRKNYPVRKFVTVCNEQRALPNSTSKFHVYMVGNVPTDMLNLLRKDRNWFKNVWYNVQDDMNSRNIIMQFYDCHGINFPRKNIYYSSGWGGDLVIAIEIDSVMDRLFDVETCAFMRLYSNQYFDTPEFNDGTGKVGIYCDSVVALNNTDKARLQTKLTQLESRGGKTLVYVNGFYTDKITLNIPDNSLIEMVYDSSILTRESYRIGGLRTFLSEKDNNLKYFIFRAKTRNHILYEDDLEVYITHNVGSEVTGVYYYQHKAESLTNVTDKDFALSTQFVNNQAQYLSDKLGGSLSNKRITLLTRRSGYNRPLVYSSLKLHELYKLPDGKEFEVISNTGYTIPEFRVEYLENSDYFKVASIEKVRNLTNTLATDAVGYNGVSYYFAKTPTVTSVRSIEVPYLYRKASTAYEYNSSGLLTGFYPSFGPAYTASEGTKFVEFIQGLKLETPGKLYSLREPIPLKDSEYRILIAQYDGINRISVWEDVTDTPLCVYSNNTVTVDDIGAKRVRVFYFDEPHTLDLELNTVDGVLVFPMTVWEDRGDGVKLYKLDLPYDSVEVFLNENRLVYGVDFFIDFPYIGICNKTYFRYSEEKQRIHIRCTGYNLDKDKINSNEIRGFISHGVLTRNNYYDIREDRVFSTFINGKLVDNSTLRFSETDNTVRTASPLNGLPYTMSEHMVSIKDVTGTSTLPYYSKNKIIDGKISSLYNIIYPEPSITEFNVIGDHHYLYSIVTAKVIHDLLDGNIPPSLYTSPYDDATIINLLNTQYKRELKLDPIKADLPYNVVEIHPHFGNDIIPVNIYQYRFISNVVRILTNNQPDRINLSGYLTVNTDTVEVNMGYSGPGGITVI